MPEKKYFSKELTLSPRSEPAGVKFPAKLAYMTLGDPSKPAIVMPTCFGGTLEGTYPFFYSTDGTSTEPLFPADKFFIVIVGLMAGGESSSPSNTPAPWNGPNFPKVTYEDSIRLQYAFLSEELGLQKVFAYIGFSMGGQQAYHIAALYPDFVENVVCLAGSARTSLHNWSFLEGPRIALETAHDFHGGHYTEPPRAGQKAFSRVYSTWALSQAWFRQKSWEKLGYTSLEAYLEESWSGAGDANDNLRLVWTWQHGDIAVYHPEDKGDLAKALGRIQARMLVMPSRTDTYFPPEDNEEEVKHLKNGELRVIESIWGHIAGAGFAIKEDGDFITNELRKFLRL